MGWLLCLVMLFVAIFAGSDISGDALIISSGLFAVAGALGSIAFNMRKEDETKSDVTEDDEWYFGN